jgi:outer membrane protein
MVFGTVSIPISGWWGGAYELEARSIQEHIAQNNLRDSSGLLLLQTEKSWRDLTNAYRQILLSEEAQAEEKLKVNEGGFANGVLPVSDLLEAQTTAQQARDRIVDARSGYRVKVTTFLSQTGRYAL